MEDSRNYEFAYHITTVLDEALGLHHLVGGVLILAGVALVMAGKKAAIDAN